MSITFLSIYFPFVAEQLVPDVCLTPISNPHDMRSPFVCSILRQSNPLPQESTPANRYGRASRLIPREEGGMAFQARGQSSLEIKSFDLFSDESIFA